MAESIGIRDRDASGTGDDPVRMAEEDRHRGMIPPSSAIVPLTGRL
jgi:hypothetical protein